MGAGAASLMARGAQAAEAMRTRPIPSSGEALQVIGMGTSRTFDVGTSPSERQPLREVLDLLLSRGGRVIDSSPMYGRAEEVVGDLLAERPARPRPFLATKVWTEGREAGIRQMETSMRRMHTDRMDLMQVHNLVDWRTQLATLRKWKEAGKIRYLGVTHYQHSAFASLEQIIRTENLDFVQLPYSLAERTAEERLLPAAADHGVAVLVMRPFERGALFRAMKGRSLPPWAADVDCTRWAQLFLKSILSPPAVTCPIPATADPSHMADNLGAGFGRLLDAPQRRELITVLES